MADNGSVYRDYGPPGSGRPGVRDSTHPPSSLLNESAVNHFRLAIDEGGIETGGNIAIMDGIYVINPGVFPTPVQGAPHLAQSPSGRASLVTEDTAASMPTPNLLAPPQMLGTGFVHSRGVRRGTPHPAVWNSRAGLSSRSGRVQSGSSAPRGGMRNSSQAPLRRDQPDSSPTPQQGALSRLRETRGRQRLNNHARDDLSAHTGYYDSLGVSHSNGPPSSSHHSRSRDGHQAENGPNNQPQSNGAIGPDITLLDAERTSTAPPDPNAVPIESIIQLRARLIEAERQRDAYHHAFEGLRERVASLEAEKRMLEQRIRWYIPLVDVERMPTLEYRNGF